MTKNISSAGPWITQREIDYVTDAVTNGWYQNWSGYLDKFEQNFADYLECEFAIATSSCTGALHIALMALDVGPGDEVIVPESTWIATAACVKYVGATPVFTDIEADTWCICPEDIERKITSKTKVIIPVHMYGHPADMEKINTIAKKYSIHVVEDAAPGIGSKIGGKLVGRFSDIACFSFQGAKPIVTGEGGMLVTSNKDLYDKAYYYWDHCRDNTKVLFNTNFGLKYKMSNIQAALGCAQLERIDEIINKRREIFQWYKQYLGEIEGVKLNVERQGYYNNFYVPSLIVERSDITAEELMSRLSSVGIANRPFFRCISKMIPDCSPAETPVADYISSRGINLPCASLLEETDIKYVADFILESLLND